MSKRYFSRLVSGCLSAVMLVGAAAQATEIAKRETRSTSGFVTERGSESRRDALSLEPNRAPSRIRKPVKSSALKSAQTQAVTCCPFYIYSADAELFDWLGGPARERAERRAAALRAKFDLEDLASASSRLVFAENLACVS